MNLWLFFPESMLRIPGVLQLPYIALLMFLLLLLFAWKTQVFKLFLLFISALFLLDLYVLFNIGPGMGRVVIPLILLSTVIVPIILWSFAWLKKDKRRALFWAASVCCAVLHSASSAVWIMALAGS